MAQVQMRMSTIAAPMTPTTSAVSSCQHPSKTPSSGMIVGVTVNQPAPAPPTVSTAISGIGEGSPSHTAPTASSPTNGQLIPGVALLKNDGASGSPSNQDTSNTNVANTKEKTPMCLINELARYNKIQHQYRLTDESGPAHKKTFTVLLKLGEEEYNASGLSIKKAQHAAANLALEKSAYEHPPPKLHRHAPKLSVRNDNLTPTVELNALAMKRGEPAEYSILEQSRIYPYPTPNLNYRGAYNHRYHYPRYGRPCYVSLRVGNRAFIGEGMTMQSARHDAAGKALRVLRDLPLPEVDRNGENHNTENGIHELDDSSDLKSPISLVHEIALKRNMRVDFEVVRESGPPHMRNFVTKCMVGTMVTEGEGNGKKLSKKRAAEKMLDELKKLPPLSPTMLKVKKPNAVKKKSRNLIKDQKANTDYGQGINPISRLIQIQQAKREREPVYTLISESGMPCRREFAMQVQVGSNTSTGSGPNKKLAKRAAAEGLLQVLGYSKPQPQPSRPAIKVVVPEVDGDKNRKVTFLDPDAVTEKGDGEGGRSGRQLVPGLLLMPDALLSGDGGTGMQGFNPHQILSGPTVGLSRTGHFHTAHDVTIAAIAKELLDHGTSTTAEAILKSGQKVIAGQPVTPKQQLAYLADVLGLTVQFTDFPRATAGLQLLHETQQMRGWGLSYEDGMQLTFTKEGNKREYLSLVSLSTNPPQVSHGAGETLEASHDQAALEALRALSELSMDHIKIKKEPGIPASENIHVGSSQNGTTKMNNSTIGDMASNNV